VPAGGAALKAATSWRSKAQPGGPFAGGERGRGTRRAGVPCIAAIGRELQDGLKRLWNWREVGASIAIMGLIGNALLGVMPEWRPSAFIIGSTGTGRAGYPFLHKRYQQGQASNRR